MIAAAVLDCVHRDGPALPGVRSGAPADGESEGFDPLEGLIARLNAQIERRDDGLDEPFVLIVSTSASVPLTLRGTRTRPGCDEEHAGRCRKLCDARSREWRAELDAAASGPVGSVPVGSGEYELVYRAVWTSDWYREDSNAGPNEPVEGRAGVRHVLRRRERSRAVSPARFASRPRR